MTNTALYLTPGFDDLLKLPCGHKAPFIRFKLEVACPTCKKVYQRVACASDFERPASTDTSRRIKI